MFFEILSVFGVLLLVVLYVILTYNRLVNKRTMAEESFSGIDVQLKRRYDLIPNLVETVKGYAKHESSLLEKVTEWRARAQGASNLDDQLKAESGLTATLANVFAVSENYPELRANTNFIELQSELAEIEEQLQLSRRFYNGTVRDLNMLIDMFPSNFVARQFGFEKKVFFEIENEEERTPTKVSF
jgi:LemA protein